MHFDELSEAVIEAEMAITPIQETEAEAKAHVLVRLVRMGFGFFVLLLGIALMPLPGPGGLVVAAGLVILARDVAWADRMLRWMRKKTPGIPEDGKIPASTIIVSGMMMTAAFLVVWYLRTNYDLPVLGLV